ncbi:hydroxymethylglutaryl-CoA reductase, degradative [Candidatus Bathyarchaeota archaeon]|nr:hydroxymethylglutaryl-CoA reductase, degradative [Candidatus Bathyarchaeota archaeon]MBS7613326.1 hydroxymethylglutaryl-CoA reductase, degradative [Candidatus Bathyarchaeota archaeon]MBS7617011.1 hydroxymethylglutaryl-CoA reductase, degradative [Candidatus Bathyarchaeota archaeon]
MERTSRITGFYKLSLEERLRIVAEFANLTEEECTLLRNTGSLELSLADRMIENVIGVMHIPLGIALNFLINGKDYIVPMAIEEPSVVAAASNAAKIARVKGGFQASTTPPVMIGQIQLVKISDPHGAKYTILAHKEEILSKANEQDPVLVKLGGGARDLEVRVVESDLGPMVITHLLVDVRDAMGANAVNTMVEAVAPLIEKLTGGKVYLRIVSNLAVYRLARAKAVFDKEALGGEDAIEGILYAYHFAKSDPFRCATHNKGIMNGIIAVALATGNDTRALEAGAHAYAARTGKYQPLTAWEMNSDGDLVGTIELPLAVGIVGGATRSNPLARVCLKVLGVKSACELAEVMASVGLAQNLAALKALATEGIQKGHMKLHARNIAIMAGATGELIDEVAKRMVEERVIRVDKAKEILQSLLAEK